MAISNAPCKGNSFILPGVLKLLPLQGDRLPPNTTQGVALGYELLPLQGVLGTGVSLKIACRRICMVSNSNEQHALNQRSPAEGKGKGQKLLATRPERAEAPSPGHRPGNYGREPVAL